MVAPWRRGGALIALMFLLVSSTVEAIDRLYGADSPQVADLARLYRIVGEPFPTVSFPVSSAWLFQAAGDLEAGMPQRVLGRFQAYLADYRQKLDYRPTEIRTAVALDLEPEFYLETSYLRSDITEKLRRESPAFTVQVSGALDDGPLLYTSVEAIREYGVEYPSNLTPPLSGNPIPYEFNNLYEGYLYWPLEFFTITFGRQKLDLGPASRSSIALANDVPYLDALRVTLELGPIRMHHSVASIDNQQAGQDVELADPSNTFYAFDRNQIYFNTHYFEYRFSRWRLGVGANLVVSREMNNFNLADFFPVFSWHNANLLPRNMSAFVDASVPVAPGFEVYGQASFDDIRTSGVGIGDQPIPTIPAFTLGGRHSRLDGGRSMDIGIDLGYTHYLWGNFPRETGLSRAIYRLRSEGENYAFPLTSPFGPGTLYAIGSFDLRGERYEFGVLYELVGRKPDANLFTTEQAESDELASQSYRPAHRLELSGAYEFTSWLSVRGRPGIYVTSDSIDLYLDLGGTISYSASRTVAEHHTPR